MTSDPQAQTEQSAPASTPAPTTTEAAPQQPLSKNAQKRIARAARIAEQKKERRAYEKEKKKEKKRELAAKRAAGELDEEQEGPRKKARLEGPRTPFGARIVVDLGFDDMMTENEVKSLTSQLAYTYNANKKATSPFSSLLFTSLNGRTFTRLEGQSDAAYKRWKDTHWWHESYERLWEGKRGEAVLDEEVKDEAKVEGEENAQPDMTTDSQTAAQGTVVYLTADSKDELSELKEGETYIIGGICDHNRYKNLCLNKAETSGIRSARLPIGTHLAELKTRKVLTVNQTFEILLKWVETRDWRDALEGVIPKRKFNEKGRAAKKGGVDEKADEPQREEAISEAVVISAADVEDDEADAEGEDDLGDDVEEAEGDTGTLVVESKEVDEAGDNGPAVNMDNTHPEVPV